MVAMGLVGCGGGAQENRDNPAPSTPSPTPVVLQGLSVSPASVTLVVGAKQTFSVTARYSDGSSQALTTGIAWSAGGTVAAVDATSGELTAKAVGSDTVTATVGTVTGTARVVVATPYQAVAGGGNHTVGIKSDGSLYGWGQNRSGQVGDGTLQDRLTPVVVGSQKTWSRVAAGEFHTVALRTDGTLWAWGLNQNGQLGMGNLATLSEPTAVGKDKDWTDVAVGSYHTLAVKKDGTLSSRSTKVLNV